MFGRRKREEAVAAEAARETERHALFARLAERPEHICPFLGLEADRTGYVEGVSDDHRCFAFGDPAPISAEQQTRVCQERGYGNCPRYLRGVLVIPTEELEALRRPRAAALPPPPVPATDRVRASSADAAARPSRTPPARRRGGRRISSSVARTAPRFSRARRRASTPTASLAPSASGASPSIGTSPSDRSQPHAGADPRGGRRVRLLRGVGRPEHLHALQIRRRQRRRRSRTAGIRPASRSRASSPSRGRRRSDVLDDARTVAWRARRTAVPIRATSASGPCS